MLNTYALQGSTFSGYSPFEIALSFNSSGASINQSDTEEYVDLLSFDDFIEIALFVRQGTGTDHFDLPFLVDENIRGVNVSDLSFDALELVACSDHIVEQVPHFCFEEVLVEPETVLDFVFEDEIVVFVR